MKGRKLSKEHKQKLSESIKGKNHPMYGKHHSKEARQKMSVSSKGKNKGKTHTEETKRKLRLTAIARIERNRGQVMPNYNPVACKLIEEYGREHGYNFQHAENGGEFHIKLLGYFVDGYDVEQNVVIEVDESYHRRQREKDKQRQQEITEHMDCEFIRIRI